MVFIAGIFAIILGVIHSILGEYLIFHRMRENGMIPTNGGTILADRQVRIIWASWHLVSLFGWALGAMLLWIDGSLIIDRVTSNWLLTTVAITMLVGSVLVLVATKAKHPGWIILAMIAVFSWLGQS